MPGPVVLRTIAYLRSSFVLFPSSCDMAKELFRASSHSCTSRAACNLSTSACSSFSLLLPLRSLRLVNRNPNQRVRQLSRLTLRLTTITILSRLRDPRYNQSISLPYSQTMTRKPRQQEVDSPLAILTARNTLPQFAITAATASVPSLSVANFSSNCCI